MPTIRPIVFPTPAAGFPSRIESTRLAGTPSRQLSHETDLKYGMPVTESGVMETACHCCALPATHT